MKNRLIVGLAAGLIAASTALTLAQNGPGRGNGKGYGGPPQSQEEREARQAACLEKNGGVCPNGGPRTNCPAGQMGQGHQYRHGLRDGTGPRAAQGTCPANPQGAAQK